MKEFINPKSAPAPVGPYSTAVKTDNGFLYLSGQISLDTASGEMKGTTVTEQSQVILGNIKNILAECGYAVTDIIKAVVYLTDLGKFGEMNEVYSQFMNGHKPIRTTIEVSKLPKGGLVEIEVTAYKSK